MLSTSMSLVGRGFHVVNLGCKVNRVESDSIAAALIARGAHACDERDADIIFVNTCTVTSEADKKARKAVRHALVSAPDAHIVVTGCAVAINPREFESMGDRVCVIQRPELMARFASVGEGSSLQSDLRIGEGFRTRVGIKVQDGCDHACTYCIVHIARGRSVSIERESVMREADRYLSQGINEIVLTGIDLGSYDDRGTKLEHLVHDLVELACRKSLPGQRPARIRASSLEPQSLRDPFVNLLASSDGMVCRHIHLPLQSGSTPVLRHMARTYSADEYRAIVSNIRERVPSLSLTTDIICGFPGESPQDFEATLEIVRECAFSKIHVFPYSKRPGTPAAGRNDQVDAAVKSRRCSVLRSLADELTKADFAQRSGSSEWVLVEGASALTESYHEIPAPDGSLPGSLVEVTL